MTETALGSYVETPLIFVQENFTDSNEMFARVYEKALAMGYVREDFLERIKAREEEFPTGLQLEHLGVAIPHTDAECVLKEFIAVVTLKGTIPFKNMADNQLQVDARILFILGLNEPHAQLEALQSLMGMLQNDNVLSEILEAEKEQEIKQIIEKN